MLKKKLQFKVIKIPPFLKNVLTLSIGGIMGQGLGFLILPILSRLYSPQEYGLFATFTGITQTVILLSTLKYDKSIILPIDKEEGDGLIALTFLIVITYSSIVTILLIVLNYFNISFGIIKEYIYLIPISVLSYGFLSVILNWWQREEKFSLMASTNIIQTSITILTSVIWGFYKLNFNGLIIGWVIGCFMIVISYLILSKKKILLIYDNSQREKMVKYFKKYINFPKYYLPYHLLSSGTTFIIPVIIVYYFSQHDSGLYSMAYRILMVPFIIISSSVSDVFIVNANKFHSTNKGFNELYKNTLNKIIVIGFSIYLVSFFIGGKIIVLFLGLKWNGIDSYVKIISIWMFFEFIAIVFKSNTYIIVQKQKIGLLIQMLNTIVSISCLIFLSQYGIEIALISFTISMALFSVINILVTYKFSKNLISNNI